MWLLCVSLNAYVEVATSVTELDRYCFIWTISLQYFIIYQCAVFIF